MLNIGGGRWRAAIIVVLVFLLHSTVCWASLQNEMQGMFNTMTNVTAGHYSEGLGRGVVSGPSVVMRSNRVRTDLINFRPPSISGGCGGIDMFMGSFSFINEDQFISLLQSIATNAAGYAFKLALSTMCPTCEAAMTSLQKAMQALNSAAGDSCRVASAGVDYLAKQMDTAGLAKSMEGGPIASTATAIGKTADAFTGFLNGVNKGSNTSKMGTEDIRAMLGNVAWKALQKNNFTSSAFVSGDNDLAQALMSVTGTIIGVKGSDDDDTPLVTDHAPLLTVKDLLDGAVPGAGDGPQRYSCDDNNNCEGISIVPYTFIGLQQLVKQTLLGADGMATGTDSFIFKLANNTGALTDHEKQLIQVSPYHMTRMRNLMVCAGGNGSQGSVPQYADKASRLLALEVIGRYLHDTLTAISSSNQGSGHDISGHNIADALVPKYIARSRCCNLNRNRCTACLGCILVGAIIRCHCN